ncbi:MAG: hypothetical protein ABI609_16145 [Acidobacteriota bacterium]
MTGGRAQGIVFVLGHALGMRLIHGTKSYGSNAARKRRLALEPNRAAFLA